MMKRQRLKIKPRVSPQKRKLLVIAATVLVAILVVGNLALWAVYHNRTYPRTKIMQTNLGSVSYDQLAKKVSSLSLIPKTLTLRANEQTVTVSSEQLGIYSDSSRATQSANKQRSWLPMLNLLTAPSLEAPIAFKTDTFSAKTKELAVTLRQDAASAQLKIDGATVTIIDSRPGYELDQAKLRQALTRHFDQAIPTAVLTVPLNATQPTVTSTALAPQKVDLEAQIQTAVTYRFNGKTKRFTTAEVASWYTPAESGYSASSDKIQAAVTSAGTGFGIRVKNANQVAASTKQGLAKKQPVTIDLVQQTVAKTLTYCVNAKGVDTSQLPALRAKLKETYSSPRGWSISNLVEYLEVTSGCDFTVWLTAPELMPTFGAICDSMWSCRVGPNVVINFARWQNASPAWNANGGTLEEYRFMVINHETGHWIGFGHAECPGAGQAAPVMQQQSIDLQGCTFSAWPSAGELTTARRYLGI